MKENMRQMEEAQVELSNEAAELITAIRAINPQAATDTMKAIIDSAEANPELTPDDIAQILAIGLAAAALIGFAAILLHK